MVLRLYMCLLSTPHSPEVSFILQSMSVVPLELSKIAALPIPVYFWKRLEAAEHEKHRFLKNVTNTGVRAEEPCK